MFGVPHAGVINAAFCHPHPLGSRFNGPNRGAWYAAFEVETSQVEVGFHKSVQLAEIGRFEDTVTYDDYMADFSAISMTSPSSLRATADKAATPVRATLIPIATSSPRRWPSGFWKPILLVYLSERSACGRHMHRLLPARIGGECHTR